MKNILDSIKETWGKLSRPMQIGAGILVLGVFLLLILLALFSRTEYHVLFSDLNPEDAGAVVTALQERGTEYKLADGGTSILVAEDDVLETRIALATSGMPTGGVVGFEIFNSTRLGETEADRALRYQWALQGELTRTIRQMSEIADARIHIVLPKRSLFVQESQPATASVLLDFKPGSKLGKGQVRGIANLVSSSVEGLSPDNVTIVDSKGNVLNAPSMAELGGDVTDRFEMQWLYEQQLENSIVAMLERIYGYGNVIARVNATLDFAYLEEYSEVFTPINRDEGLVRSTQSSEETYRGASSGGGGVPGVDSNIPGYVFTEDDGDYVEWDRRDGTTNYELNRKETRSTVLPGGVSNINVSVWINGDLDPIQLESIEESVVQATGLRVNRGDSVYVASVPFESSPFLGEEVTPDVPQGIPLYWVLALLAFFILVTVLLVVRSRRVRIAEEETLAASLDIVVDDEHDVLEEVLTEEEQERRNIRKRIQEMAKEKPEEIALLMKTWLIDD